MFYSASVYIAFVVTPILTVISQGCSWCSAPDRAPDITTCGVTDPDSFTLVRAIGASWGKWFNNDDSLAGTDPHVDDGKDQYNYGSFEAAVPGFNQFLFVTGDCTSWLITSKNAIGGVFGNDYYSNTPRTVCASSEHPHIVSHPKWYNRNHCCAEDPWISTIDHSPAISAGKIVYGEANYGGTHASTVVARKNGVYVYIRNVPQLGDNGCSDPCSACGVCETCNEGACEVKCPGDGLYCNGEEYCDPISGECKDGEDVECPENMLCDNDQATCVRDCDSFAIDSYLTECSLEFDSDQDDILGLQEDVERIDGEIDGEITVRLDDIDADIKFLHKRIDGFRDYAPNADAEADAGLYDNINSYGGFSEFKGGYFDSFKDEIIIGLVVMNMVTFIGMCCILFKKNNKRYHVVRMQESDEEQKGLKQ